LGLSATKLTGQLNYGVPPNELREPTEGTNPPASAALSMTRSPGPGIQTRKFAILAADGFTAGPLAHVQAKLESEGAVVQIVAPNLGTIKSDDGSERRVDAGFLTASSALFDAVYVVGGRKCAATLAADRRALCFLNEAFGHCKSIGATGYATAVLVAARVLSETQSHAEGIYLADDDGAELVAAALVEYGTTRHWARELMLIEACLTAAAHSNH
jgi:catalase